MDFLARIFESGNTVAIVIVAVILVLIIAFLAKKGIVSFNGFGLKIDNGEDDERERTVIRSQIQYAQTAVGDFYHSIPYWEGRDEWRLKYIMSLISDIFVSIAMFNHVTTEPIYVELKQRAVWQCIIDNADNPQILTDDFKSKVYKETENIIKKFIEIRKYHKEEKK